MLCGGINVHSSARSWVALAHSSPVIEVRALFFVLSSMNNLRQEQHKRSGSMVVGEATTASVVEWGHGSAADCVGRRRRWSSRCGATAALDDGVGRRRRRCWCRATAALAMLWDDCGGGVGLGDGCVDDSVGRRLRRKWCSTTAALAMMWDDGCGGNGIGRRLR
eukprot:922961-Pleurochrysis_carterae.AAC.3